MRKRRRVTGRFYIFLAILLAIAFLIIRPYLNFGDGTAVIMTANSSFSKTMDCVIIRDESVVSAESAARVEYLTPENSLVQSGDQVAYVYTAGYSENLLKKLEETRVAIQDYHKNVMLKDIKDTDLERLDTIVDMMAQQFKDLVTHDARGSLLTVTRQLETAMVNRQEYLRSNKRDDTKLTKLYDEENTRMTSIQSWRTIERASDTGVVSFYTDGNEDDLNADTVSTLSISDIKTVLAGKKLSRNKTKTTPVYRLVNQNRWYVALITDGQSWNPVVGQPYYVEFEGFEDLTYNSSVTSVQKEGNTSVAILEIDDPIGSMIYQRTGRARLSATISGLSIETDALYEQNGQMGVWLYDVEGGTFVPVDVLSSDGKTALIQPLVENALQLGQRVLIKK